ncbi:MAG TPA: VanZ family protein [Polyangiaceae bacterium]|nr:VanZ family protein [Polyangiaceae bacterium]
MTRDSGPKLAAKLRPGFHAARHSCKAWSVIEKPFVPPHTKDISRPPFGFVTHVLPSVAYASAIFYGGLIQIGALPEVGFVATDKLLHALVFGGLGLLVSRAVHWLQPSATLARKLWLGCAGSSFLGLLLEVCQAFTTYRSADAWDWVADTVGALLALGLAFLFFALLPRRAHG